MNILFKPLIFCLAIASMSVMAPLAAQACQHPDSADKESLSVEVSFEPKKPGECTGDKCAAGGSY